MLLRSVYGRMLIIRYTYGAAVPEIDNNHVAQIQFPLLKDKDVQSEINRLALDANAKRTEAYHAEQRAIRITNEEVVHACAISLT